VLCAKSLRRSGEMACATSLALRSGSLPAGSRDVAGQGDRREARGFLAAEVGGYGCGTLRDQLIVGLASWPS
jgi:hypothetical protein